MSSHFLGGVPGQLQIALKELFSANPEALMFGTDLPSTRAPRAYEDSDLLMIIETLDPEGAEKVLYSNAVNFYRPDKSGR